MGRRTVSNLQRELKVSRPTIYKKAKELNLQYEDEEYSLPDYELLKKELSTISDINKSKKKLPKIKVDADISVVTKLNTDDQSTLRERLKKAKDQYDFNHLLIMRFQSESDEYFRLYQKTTCSTHNGTESVIPAITSLEKYVKLNIALSKLISDLESDLDLSEDSEDDPYA